MRVTKLHEFVAHSSAVNCLHIGRKSSSVMVTGGDDNKVNVWAFGKGSAVMSLTGHTSPVECVSFDSNEQTVIAGSAGGTLKLWDLDQGKVARTLTGHRSNCTAVQWHPYGEFFASGSVDTKLKIWDIRRKACIQTYRGHAQTIRQIHFSPDGRWVISGGDDGAVKLWDLTMGRLVREFNAHAGAITAIAVHPAEFLMATASADRTLRLWDLDTFDQISCLQPESGGQARRVTFSEDGRALLSGGEESLTAWGWEPVRCFEHADVRWSRLADMGVATDQKLVAASVRESMVAVWSVDLSTAQPFGAAPGAAASAAAGGSSGGAPCPSPCRTWVAPSDTLSGRAGDAAAELPAPGGALAGAVGARAVAAAASNGLETDGLSACCARVHIADCPAPPASSPAVVHGSGLRESGAPSAPPSGVSGLGGGAGSRCTDVPAAPGLAGEAASTPAPRQASPDRVPSASEPLRSAQPPVGAEELLPELLEGCRAQRSRLVYRLQCLRALRSAWVNGAAASVARQLRHSQDPTVPVDLVRAAMLTGGVIDLEFVVTLLPTLASLLDSRHEQHQLAALAALSQTLKRFRPGELGPAAERRQPTVQACVVEFMAMQVQLDQLASRGGRAGTSAAEVLQAMSGMLQGTPAP